jgi:hypothetical protein
VEEAWIVLYVGEVVGVHSKMARTCRQPFALIYSHYVLEPEARGSSHSCCLFGTILISFVSTLLAISVARHLSRINSNKPVHIDCPDRERPVASYHYRVVAHCIHTLGIY